VFGRSGRAARAGLRRFGTTRPELSLDLPPCMDAPAPACVPKVDFLYQKRTW